MTLPGFLSRRSPTLADRTRATLRRALQALPVGPDRTAHERRRARLVRAGAAATAAAVTLGAYRYGVQPWHRTWGATEAEVAMSLPGDGLVPHPSYTTTRAITIDAPPEAVWPWIVQMGQGRAGFYSYDWLEALFGLDIHNADEVEPEWQDLAAGDTVRLAPKDQYGGHAQMRVVHLDPNRALVFGPIVDTPEDLDAASRTGAGTWAFVLSPLDDDQTRFIVRTRSRPWRTSRIVSSLYDPAHFLMERRMLMGIKDRAESRPRPHAPEARDGEQPVPVHS